MIAMKSILQFLIDCWDRKRRYETFQFRLGKFAEEMVTMKKKTKSKRGECERKGRADNNIKKSKGKKKRKKKTMKIKKIESQSGKEKRKEKLDEESSMKETKKQQNEKEIKRKRRTFFIQFFLILQLLIFSQCKNQGKLKFNVGKQQKILLSFQSSSFFSLFKEIE